MAYWWQRYSSTPDSNTDTPPDGAPENHFPDQVNNIQRQAMAAVNELGALILGPGDGSPAPQTAATSISGSFLKLIYDQLLPINTIQGWDSVGGTLPFPVPEGTAFASVAWELCDSTGSAGTPNFQDVVLAGANSLAGPEQKFTGDLSDAEDTSDDGAWSKTGRVSSGHAISIAQMPVHNHTVNDPGHGHSASTNADRIDESNNLWGPEGTGIRGVGATVTIVNNTTGISIANRGSGNVHNHVLPDISEPDHDHITGQPPRAALELYKRVA